MKAIIILTIVLSVAILGHDAWVAYDKNLDFALSDFGWMISTYVPQAEEYIIETLSADDQARYVAPVFQLETIWVILILMGVFFSIAFLANVSENLEGLRGTKFFSKKKKSNAGQSLKKRDRNNATKYKRK